MKLNIQGSIVPLVAAIFLTYGEVKKDYDNRDETNSNMELMVFTWSSALALLLGTTTAGQTKDIAVKEAEKIV